MQASNWLSVVALLISLGAFLYARRMANNDTARRRDEEREQRSAWLHPHVVGDTLLVTNEGPAVAQGVVARMGSSTEESARLVKGDSLAFSLYGSYRALGLPATYTIELLWTDGNGPHSETQTVGRS